jgi:hypothetical protein
MRSLCDAMSVGVNARRAAFTATRVACLRAAREAASSVAHAEDAILARAAKSGAHPRAEWVGRRLVVLAWHDETTSTARSNLDAWSIRVPRTTRGPRRRVRGKTGNDVSFCGFININTRGSSNKSSSRRTPLPSRPVVYARSVRVAWEGLRVAFGRRGRRVLRRQRSGGRRGAGWCTRGRWSCLLSGRRSGTPR